MKRIIIICIGISLLVILAGCFNENDDVDVPSAHVTIGENDYPLSDANVQWEAANHYVHKRVRDVIGYGFAQERIHVKTNDIATLHFEENEQNSGDIWTGAQVHAKLLNHHREISVSLDDKQSFELPISKGKYVLEVEFKSEAGSAQYVANLIIE